MNKDELDKFIEFASSLDEDKDYQLSNWEEYTNFANRRNESYATSRLREILDELAPVIDSVEDPNVDLDDLYNLEFAKRVLKEYIYKECPLLDDHFFERHYGVSSAYSKALAYESYGDWKFDHNPDGTCTLNDEQLESYARTVAYKVASNLALGHRMDPDMDPLKYVNCGGGFND